MQDLDVEYVAVVNRQFQEIQTIELKKTLLF